MQNAPREHSAILSTFIELPFAFKTFVLSIFEWSLKTSLLYFFLWKLIVMANSAESDVKPHSVAFYLGLHCSLKCMLGGSSLQKVNS